MEEGINEGGGDEGKEGGMKAYTEDTFPRRHFRTC